MLITCYGVLRSKPEICICLLFPQFLPSFPLVLFVIPEFSFVIPDSLFAIPELLHYRLQYPNCLIPTSAPSMAAKPLLPLRPVRHKSPDLFSIDINSISLKDSRQHLEFPFFALATRLAPSPRTYKDRNGNHIDVIPSSLGMPTILDKDVLIYAISHIMHARNCGDPVSRRVVIYSADMLRFANRPLGGRDYTNLERSILRLRGCTIRTNIRTGDIEETEVFGILDSASLRRKYDQKGRLMHCEVTLSEWLWRALESNEILTLHPDYFRLRRPLERRLYELARKHCGRQPAWSISLTRLYEKSASRSSLRYFRMQIRQIARQAAERSDYLPGYTIEFADAADQVTFRSRPDAPILVPDADDAMDETTWQDAQTVAPGFDVRDLHREWLAWRHKQALPPPRLPAAAFLGFVRAFVRRRHDAIESGSRPPATADEPINVDLLTWWRELPEARRTALEDAHRIYRVQGEDFFRSDKQLIERAAKVGLPKGV